MVDARAAARQADRVVQTLIARLSLVLLIAGCAAAPPARPPPARCALPAPVELVRDGEVILVRWDLPAGGPWLGETLPDAPAYLAYRRAIREAGAERARPIADEVVATTAREREVWRRERANAELVYGGDAGRVRPVRCLDAALFAYQHARYDQLAHPTEFVAAILRRGPALRVYLGASGELFPPKRVYGIDEARRDVAAGWRFVAHLHNHTVQRRGDRPALGTPAPSTNDVHLLRGVAGELGLEAAWVTNGVFTGEVPAAALARFHAPP